MIVLSNRNLFCGSPGLSPQQVVYSCSGHDVCDWFDNKRVYYFHKARIGIRLVCELLDITSSDEVLAPAYNCGTEIDALLSSGALVTLYRVDRSALVDLTELCKRISSKTRAIYVTHFFGFPQPLDEIKSICEQNNLYLLEDCALSLFSSNGSAKLGSTGDVAIFNFPKSLPVPDGGAMIINNPSLAVDSWITQKPPVLKIVRTMLSLLKRYVLHKSSGSKIVYQLLWHILRKRRKQQISDEESKGKHLDIPDNYYYDEKLSYRRMSRTSERVLRTFDLERIVSRRRTNFNRYLESLSGVEGIEPLYKELPKGVCPLYFPIIMDKRAQVCQLLNEVSIEAISWWSGYHQSLPWNQYPDACFLKDNLLVLPVHHQLNDEHINFVASKLKYILDKLGTRT